MKTDGISYVAELPAHDAQIEAINAEAFGPGRFTRAAYRIREGGPHEETLSHVAVHGSEVVASVRMTPIAAGGAIALLLGPLAVKPEWKNFGIGRRLVAIALDGARDAGWPLVILVGDGPYYAPLGFDKVVPHGQIAMPRPVDPRRLLAHEIAEGALAGFRGEVVHAGPSKPAAAVPRLK